MSRGNVRLEAGTAGLYSVDARSVSEVEAKQRDFS